MSSVPAEERRVLQGGRFEVPVRWAGRGRPLLYLHGAWGFLGGLEPSGHLSRMAERYLVLAPSHPGFDGATGLEHLDDALDLALYYLDFLDELMLDSPYLVGHGFGALIAAEMAALAPQRIAKLVLIAPYGLRLDDAPLPDIFALSPEQLRATLWHDPASAPPGSDDPAARLLEARNLAAAAKFIWPDPTGGLRKRLHRLIAPTLLVRGERDRIVPPASCEAFQRRLAYARLLVVPAAGHLPQLEQPRAFSSAVLEFLEG